MSSQSRLSFLTCGSVDDGKSSLIGRILYDAGQIYADQLAQLEIDSAKYGTRGDNLDFALLLDGLQDERNQGITIDVAYRYFSTGKRSFVVADTPGHEQYTRNMAVAASKVSAAIVLVDARKGLIDQSLRHLRILSMMRVSHVALAINKMDLIDWDQGVYESISQEFNTISTELGFTITEAIPTSAIGGENLFASSNLDWYQGPTLIEWLENVPGDEEVTDGSLVLPIQYILRPNSQFRGYCGRIARGSLRPGDKVTLSPSKLTSTIENIIVAGEETNEAKCGDSVCITLENEIDISRGDVICGPDEIIESGEQFQTKIIWLAEKQLVAGRSYWLKLHHATVPVTISSIRNRVDIATGAKLSAHEINLNDICVANLSLDRPIPFMPYSENRNLGGFILIDRSDNATVAAGMIDYDLRRDHNISWQNLTIDRAGRAAIKHQSPHCIWLTGLSGSGKSTIADALDRYLFSKGKHTYILDGDNVRHGLNRDLGFSEADRAENTRRTAEVAKLLVDAGLIVIVAIISPYQSDRDHARSLFNPGEFIEVFVDTPLEICETRDPKGLYGKARRGEIPNFTGITSPYEPPLSPELRIEGDANKVSESVAQIIAAMN